MFVVLVGQYILMERFETNLEALVARDGGLTEDLILLTVCHGVI